MTAPILYTKAHRKHWERIKGIDFPSGDVAILDGQGKAVIHRPHSRQVLRKMARDAARRDVKAQRSKPLQVAR